MRSIAVLTSILLACTSAGAQQPSSGQVSPQQGSAAQPDALTYTFLTIRENLAWEPITFRRRDDAVSARAVAKPPAASELATLVGPAADFTPDRLCDALASAAAAHDLPLTFFTRLIWQESRFDPLAVSRAGAQGMAQFMPAVAAEKGLTDPFNPEQALPTSARFLGELKRQFGNVGLAAAAYNAGARRVQDWLAKRATLPRETRDYVVKITGVAPERWVKIATAVETASSLPSRLPCAFTPEATAVASAVPLPPARPSDLPQGAVVVAEHSESKPEPARHLSERQSSPREVKARSEKPATSVKLASTAGKPVNRKGAVANLPAKSFKHRKPEDRIELAAAKRRLREATKVASRETAKAAERERRELAATMRIATSEKTLSKSGAKGRKSATFAVAARDENNSLRKPHVQNAESRTIASRKPGSAKLRVATAGR